MRLQAEEIRRMEKEEGNYLEIAGGNFATVYDLTFYFDPLDYKGQRAYAILNYYQVSFKQVETTSKD